MRSLRILAAAIVLSILPIGAYAQTSSVSSQASLVAQITALEQEIQALTSGSTSPTTTSSPSATSGNSCPVINETLSIGETGPDVSSLQAFLSAEGSFNNSITGYFGVITQQAVAEWQESHGVVSGGDANSTGLGVVGPHTRAAIAASCSGVQTLSQSCLPAQPPVSSCSTGWRPITDANGCTTYYQCALPLPGATNTTTTTTSTATNSQSCPVVAQPACNGTVQPFQYNANGCVISYECTL